MKGIIDAHCHPMHWPSRPGVSPRGRLPALPDFYYHDPVDQSDQYVGIMDSVGIDIAVIMSEIGQTSPEFVASMVSKHPGRFIGFSNWVYPATGREAAMQIEHMVGELGIAGVGEMILGAFYPTPPHEVHRLPELVIIMDKIAELEVPILFHTGFLPIPLPLSYMHPFLIDELANVYPDVPIIMGHSGHPVSHFDPEVVDDLFFEACLLVAEKHGNVYFEISFCTAAHVERIVRAVGVEACLFGTDGSVRRSSEYFQRQVDAVLDAPITGDDKDHILRKNAARLLEIG